MQKLTDACSTCVVHASNLYRLHDSTDHAFDVIRHRRLPKAKEAIALFLQRALLCSALQIQSHHIHWNPAFLATANRLEASLQEKPLRMGRLQNNFLTAFAVGDLHQLIQYA